MDCSPPGSSIHRTIQARKLELGCHFLFHGIFPTQGLNWHLLSLLLTEQLHFHFSLACIGEGNGNPLQCSCLENPRDGGAWWAAAYEVAQSRTQLKRLSSSRSSLLLWQVGSLPLSHSRGIIMDNHQGCVLPRAHME